MRDASDHRLTTDDDAETFRYRYTCRDCMQIVELTSAETDWYRRKIESAPARHVLLAASLSRLPGLPPVRSGGHAMTTDRARLDGQIRDLTTRLDVLRAFAPSSQYARDRFRVVEAQIRELRARRDRLPAGIRYPHHDLAE